MFMRTLCLIGLLTLTFFGCGTDVKPSAISGVFSSEAVMDDVSNCIIAPPIIDENADTVTITADNACLISIVGRLGDPVSIADIIKSPPKYVGKQVTFTAEVESYIEGYFDDRGRYLPYMIQLDTSQADGDVDFQVTYHDSLYHGGIPHVGEVYEFTVIIDSVSYESNGVVYIAASHGSIEYIEDIDDVTTKIPVEEPPLEPDPKHEPDAPADAPLDAE